jgi:methyl-accepting chemotaxis protein
VKTLKLPSFITKLKQKKILVQFFLVFCLLIIVPVAVTNNIVYLNSRKVIENEINQYNDQIMENMIENVDTKLWEIFNCISTLNNSDCLKTVLKRSNGSKRAVLNQYDVTNLRELLKNLKKSEPLIEEVCIYFVSDDAIISNDGYYDINSYFNEKKRFDNISTDQWKKLLQEKHTFEMLNSQTIHEKNQSSDIPSNSITLISSVPGQVSPESAILVFINQNSINNIISEYCGIKKNDYFIADAHGNPVAQFANNKLLQNGDIREISLEAADSGKAVLHKTTDNGRLAVTSSVSSLTNWVYIIAAPLKEMYRQSLFIRNSTLIVCVVCILLGLVISIVLSKKMYRPISNIVDFINRADSSGNADNAGNSEKTNEFKLIVNHLDKMLEDNKALKDSLVKDIPYLSENLLYRILHNSFTSEAEVLENMEKLGIRLDKEDIIVMSIKLDVFNLKDGSSHKSAVMNISEKITDIIFNMLKQKFKCFFLNEGSFSTFIINFNSDEEERLMNLCNEICGLFHPEDYKQRISIGIGSKCTSIMQAFISYNQSIRALSYITISCGNQIIVYDENLMNSFSKRFDTNIDLNPVYNSLLAGDPEKAVFISGL